MTLEEILEDSDLLVQNSLPSSKKIQWINQIHRQLFREFNLPIKIHKEKTVSAQVLYTLPTDCEPSDIDRVYLGGEEVPYEPYVVDENITHWKIEDGKLALYPKMNTVHDLAIYYKPSPTDLMVSDMNVEPDFPKDFHELLSIGLAIKIAKRSAAYDVANVLQQEYDALFQNARRVLSGPRKRKVTILNSWE